jgi:hypothetical protein
MNLVSTETSLVVAGAWNPAILTPPWVLKHGLGRQLGEGEQIQVFMPAGSGLVYEFPRYVLPELTYMVRPDTLVLSPSESTEGSFAILENAAAAMLETLSHTPVTGIGHNFEFRETEPEADQLAVFTISRQDVTDAMPAGWDAAATSLTSSFRKQDGSVIANITRRFDAGTVSAKFNFHHPLTTTEAALQVLRGENNFSRMASNFQVARQLVADLYGGGAA